jgi:3',5'-cyclic AMP phosphodiesterase CpdA
MHAMIRVLHVSDVHVDVPVWRMPLLEMLGKRAIGAANLVLRRHRHFHDAREKLASLARFALEQRVDVVICTGDYTALGTAGELEAARVAVDPLVHAGRLGFVTVPGNHDLYMPDTVRDRRFDRVFGDLLTSDLPELATADGWPRVRLFDDQLAVVSVNSARPNPQPWRSSGRIPEPQLRALGEALRDPRVAQRNVLIATHYAPRRPDGSPDKWSHGLENADELLAICAQTPRCAILHGHIHWRLHLPGPPMLFGSGSTTHHGREGLWLFELEREGGSALPGTYRDGKYQLEPDARVPFR